MMLHRPGLYLVFGLLLFSGCRESLPVEGTQNPIKASGILDLTAIQFAKTRIQAGDPVYLEPYMVLKHEAHKALELDPPSVMDKQFLPPSSDKHDYMSMSPYWWPDPNSPDGLPYIRRDGEVNPERDAYDKLPGATMSEAVETLTLMYYFADEERYAKKAAEYLRTWFLDEATRMNPHLEYGQFVPGARQGRSVGIIETRNFVFLTDYEPLLLTSEYWTAADHIKFKAWMNTFLDWLVTSDLGRQEGSHTNNHGSWYDYQVLALSQYCQQSEPGKRILHDFSKKRIQKQIAEDGSQPEELARTKSFSYSAFNLMALCNTLILSENDTEFKGRFSNDLPTLAAALNYLTPVVTDEANWSHQQIRGIPGALDRVIPVMVFIYERTQDEQYLNDLSLLLKKYPQSRYILTTRFATLVRSNPTTLDRG